MALIPNLYGIQKIIQDNKDKYGTCIYIDPSDHPHVGDVVGMGSEGPILMSSLPGKETNINTMVKMGDALYNFSTARRGIENNRSSQIYSVHMFMWSVFVILLVIFLVVVLLTGYMWEASWFEIPMQVFLTLACLLIVAVVGLAMHVNFVSGFGKIAIYNKVLNVTPFISNEIAKLNEMFNVTGVSNNDVQISSTNPAMVWHWSKHHANIDCQWEQDGKWCHRMADIHDANPHGGADQFIDSCGSNIKWRQMYPFVGCPTGVMAIDPVKLKKDIQRFDLYGQLARMKTSIGYFQGFMLRQNDSVYGQTKPSALTEAQTSNLRAEIAAAIFTGGGGSGNWSFSDYLVTHQNQLVGKITDLIVTSDPSKSFSLSSQDVSAVTNMVFQSVGDSNEIKIANGPLVNILTDVQGRLPLAWSAEQEVKDPAYIPMERFVQKVGTMNANDFLKSFVFNIEELRATSEGIQQMNELYDITGTKQTITAQLSDAGVYWFMAIILLLSIMFVFPLFVWFGSNGSEDKSTTDSVQHSTKETSHDAVKIEVKDEVNLKKTFDFSKYVNQDNIATLVSNALIWIVLVSVLIICFLMAWSYGEKKKARAAFNRDIMVTNGRTIANESQDALALIFEDVNANKYGIKDPKIEGDQAMKSSEQLYEQIVSITNQSPNANMGLQAGNQLDMCYEKMLSILEAYNSCNSLFSINTQTIQFPIVETTSYAIIIILIASVTILLFHPMVALNPYEMWKKVTGGASASASASQSGGIDGKAGANIGLQLVALVIIVIVVYIFASGITSNTNDYMAGLYSNLLTSASCH